MQKVIIGGIAGTGIVATLVLLGGGLKYTGLATQLGEMAMAAGMVIGVILGILGIIGIVSRML